MKGRRRCLRPPARRIAAATPLGGVGVERLPIRAAVRRTDAIVLARNGRQVHDYHRVLLSVAAGEGEHRVLPVVGTDPAESFPLAVASPELGALPIQSR